MAGTLTITTLSDGTNSTSSTNCIQGSAKAWVRYNGVAQTITSSYNVSSVTYSSTGNYIVNFTNAFVDANYAVATSAATAGSTQVAVMPFTAAFAAATATASSLPISSAYYAAVINSTTVCVSVFR